MAFSPNTPGGERGRGEVGVGVEEGAMNYKGDEVGMCAGACVCVGEHACAPDATSASKHESSTLTFSP